MRNGSQFLPILSLMAFLLGSAVAYAQAPSSNFNFEGKLTDGSGTPVTDVSVNFQVEVLNPAGTCVVYREDFTGIDLSTTNGNFNLVLGTGSRTDGHGHSFKQAFMNSGAMGPVAVICPALYTPAAGDHRDLRITVTTPSINASTPTTLTTVSIGNSPTTTYAETIQGIAPTSLLQVNTSGVNELNQANLESVFTTANRTELMALIGGTSTQYMDATPTSAVNFASQRLTSIANPINPQDAATKDYSDTKIGGTNANISGVSGVTGNGKVLSWNQASGEWQAVDFDASNIASGTIDKDRLPTTMNAITMGGALDLGNNAISNVNGITMGAAGLNMNNNEIINVDGLTMGTGALDMTDENIINAGHITMSSSKYLQLGRFNDAQELSLLATPLVAVHEGVLWYDSEDDTFEYWDGSAVQQIGSGGGGSGDSIADTDSDTQIRVEASADEDIIRFDTAGTERAQLDAGGNFVIGTSTTAMEVLHLSRLTAMKVGMRITNSATGFGATDGFQVAAMNDGRARLWNFENTDMLFGANDNEAMVLSAGGNLGIGTSGPNAKLHVDGGNILVGPNGTATGQAGRINLAELGANGSDSVAIRAPDAVTTGGYILELPDDTGLGGQILSTDGGNPAKLTWAPAPTGDITGVTAGNGLTGGGTGGTVTVDLNLAVNSGLEIESDALKMDIENLPTDPINTANDRIVFADADDTFNHKYTTPNDLIDSSSAVRGSGGSSVDHAIARWHGTTAKDVQNSGVLIDDSNNVSGIADLGITGDATFAGNIGAAEATFSKLVVNATTLYVDNTNNNVGIGTAAPSTSAILQLESTTKGFRPPAMTTAQRDAIVAPVEGLTIYNTDDDKMNVYASGSWTNVGGGTDFGSGNSGFAGAIEFPTVAGCTWVRTSATYGAFTADGDCSLGVLRGGALQPSTAQTPGLRFASLPAGRYRVTANGRFFSSGGPGPICRYRISDGTTRFGFAEIPSSGVTGVVTGVIEYTSAQTNLEFQIHNQSPSAGNCTIDASIASSESDLRIVVTRIDGSGTAVRIADDDGDTAIEAEQSADEDIIRFITGGTERMTIDNTGQVSVPANVVFTGPVNFSAATISDNSIAIEDLDFASTSGINIPQQVADPGTAVEGQIYYNSTSDVVRIYDGTTWHTVGGATSLDGLSDVELNAIDAMYIGPGSGGTAPTGNRNLGIGANTLGDATLTGGDNVAIGASAGDEIVAGTSNTILGSLAARNFDFAGNVVIGFQAGEDLDADNNVIIGMNAAKVTTASDNVVIGQNAGAIQTDARRNILIGSFAGDEITTGDRNIIIGYDIDAPSNTANDQLNIGNLIYGTSLDGFDGTISSGSIGIGTQTPNARLESFSLVAVPMRSHRSMVSTTGLVSSLQLVRSTSGGTPPNSGFGSQLEFMLEGSTNDDLASAGHVAVRWDSDQTNDTSDRDSSMAFWTAKDGTTSEKMRIQSDGRVSVNDTNGPADAVFFVNGNGNTAGFTKIAQFDETSTGRDAELMIRHSNIGKKAILNLQRGSVPLQLSAETLGGDESLHVQVNGGSSLVFTEGGRVGINTTSPQTDLEIDGSGSIKLPAGTQLAIAQRQETAHIRYNTDNNKVEVKEGGNWHNVVSDFVAVRYHATTSQTLAGGNVETVINFDSQIFDDGSDVVDASTNWHFVAPVTGYYMVAAKIGLFDDVGNRAVDFAIRAGPPGPLAGMPRYVLDASSGGGYEGYFFEGSTLIRLDAGDEVYLTFVKNNATNVNLDNSDNWNWVTIHRVGP